MLWTDNTKAVLILDNGKGETYRLEGICVNMSMEVSNNETYLIPTIQALKSSQEREAFYD